MSGGPPPPRATGVNPFRVLIGVDVALAVVGAALCLATPREFAGQYLTTPFTHPGDAFVRWLGLMFVFYAAALGRGLLVGDRAFWRTVLPAVALGDAMHLASSLWRVAQPDFHASSASLSDLAIVAVYFPRVWLARHSERLDRRARTQLPGSPGSIDTFTGP